MAVERPRPLANLPPEEGFPLETGLALWENSGVPAQLDSADTWQLFSAEHVNNTGRAYSASHYYRG
jgi:hypothetical protein